MSFSDLLPEVLALSSNFKKYFEVVPAFSLLLKEEVYRIRHAVFCEELRFEPERPDRRESDEYDRHSMHLLIRNVHTGEFVGCTRMILRRPEDPQYPLPFEKICQASIDRTRVDPAKLPRDCIAEISRLAVISRFRNRSGEGKHAIALSDSDFATKPHPRFPYIPVGLYLGTVELARLHGITTLFMLTETRLSVHFQKLGAKLQSIGSPVEHRGQRVPSMMKTSDVITNMRALFRPLYRTIGAQVDQYGGGAIGATKQKVDGLADLSALTG
jgi:N-acyl amino acid synthase of PEP-CTERM/exosortase system